MVNEQPSACSTFILLQHEEVLFLKMGSFYLVAFIFNFLLLKAFDLFLGRCSKGGFPQLPFDLHLSLVAAVEVSWKDFRKDIFALDVNMTTRVLGVVDQDLLQLLPPPPQTVGKDINRKHLASFISCALKFFFQLVLY